MPRAWNAARTWAAAALLRHRHRRRFARLSADPRFAAWVVPLRHYIAWTIPYPARTELSYWSLSAVPATNAATYPRLLTLSVQTLETLFVSAPKRAPEDAAIRVNVDLPSLLDVWGSLDCLMARSRGLHAYQAAYRTRPTVAALAMDSPRTALRVLCLPGVLAAARRLNLDLMRKGAAINWRTHCFDLADLVCGPVSTART